MPSPSIQKNETFQYRKENSFYVSIVLLFIIIFMIVVFKASYTDVSILVILHLSFLLTHGVLNETVIVSNNHIIIKYNVLCFNTTTKKLWQEITHVKQYNHKGKIKLRLNLLDENSKDLSNNYIELCEPDEGKMYDFICLCLAIKSQASSHNISIDDQKSTEKSSLFKKVLSYVVIVGLIIIFWVFLPKLNLFTPHAMHSYTLIIWLVILFISPYVLGFLYLKRIAQTAKQSLRIM